MSEVVPHYITQLVASKRKPERVNIFVDGAFCLQVHVDIIAKYRVAKGAVWNDELREKLLDDKRRMKIKALALSFATYKMRSTEQVRERLRLKECNEQEIEDAIAFLLEFSYLNDQQYAEMFIRDRLLRRAVSATRLFQELRKRGVSKSDAERALQISYPQERTAELARVAAQKKLRMVSYRPIEKQRKALSDYLQRQGFEWSLIKTVLQEIFQAEHEVVA